ncbi:MAG: hypothetical protein NT138_26375 [Planctomycetales bacterium]|nr:hypothetical protein [Planctomycetales bacterium]
MNYKPQTFPHFAALTVMAAFLLSIGGLTRAKSAVFADESAAAATPAATDSQPPAETPAPAKAAAPDPNLPAADEIMTQLRTKLEGLDSLRCELHQTSLISGMKLTARGKYLEASGNRVNLQFMIFPMVAEKADDAKQLALDAEAAPVDETQNRGILNQVSDGSVLSTLWKNGDMQRVSRRNITSILAAAEATKAYDVKNAAMDLGVGGLRGLVSRLQTMMEFAPVKSITVGDRKVYEVTGRWSERIRKDVFKVPEGSVVDPRPHVPEYTRVYVDAETMLPRRIQFLKRSMDPTAKMVRPLITLDFRNLVINEPVDDQAFVFKTPEKAVEVDETENVIQMIQQSLKPASADGGTPAAAGAAGAAGTPATPTPPAEPGK